MITQRRTTRLAPSPTGALHLGNARTFLITWAIARKSLWDIILRIEDMDTPRVKPGVASAIADTLTWLGMDWDPPAIGPPDNPLVQSTDLKPYQAAMRQLASRGLAYPCDLTRAQIEAAASAPQQGAHDTPFPAALRPESAGRPLDFDRIQRDTAGTNWRLLVQPGPTRIDDRIAGPHSFDVASIVGDFVLWTRRDQPSYQLAVVVDDHRQGVTDVIRGDDLLDSAARQRLLYHALDLGDGPAWWHVPLVVGPDKRRLAKRHGDTRIDRYRAAGVRPERIVGLIASWSIPGIGRRPTSAAEFASALDLSTLPRGPVVCTPEDEAWLLDERD
jgi:glutamyl-tRNA synthetase